MLSHGGHGKTKDNTYEKHSEKILNNTYLADLSMWIAKFKNFTFKMYQVIVCYMPCSPSSLFFTDTWWHVMEEIFLNNVHKNIKSISA